MECLFSISALKNTFLEKITLEKILTLTISRNIQEPCTLKYLTKQHNKTSLLRVAHVKLSFLSQFQEMYQKSILLLLLFTQ